MALHSVLAAYRLRFASGRLRLQFVSTVLLPARVVTVWKDGFLARLLPRAGHFSCDTKTRQNLGSECLLGGHQVGRTACATLWQRGWSHADIHLIKLRHCLFLARLRDDARGLGEHKLPTSASTSAATMPGVH